MCKKINKIFILIFFIIFTFSFGFMALAGPLNQNTAFGVTEPMAHSGKEAGYDISGNIKDLLLSNIVSIAISAFLGLLGIIFVILIIIAGYNWMTAAGDEAKVTKAKETLQRAVIGLIIIIAAYAITAFVFKSLPWGTGGGPGGSL